MWYWYYGHRGVNVLRRFSLLLCTSYLMANRTQKKKYVICHRHVRLACSGPSLFTWRSTLCSRLVWQGFTWKLWNCWDFFSFSKSRVFLFFMLYLFFLNPFGKDHFLILKKYPFTRMSQSRPTQENRNDLWCFTQKDFVSKALEELEEPADDGVGRGLWQSEGKYGW